MTAEERIKYTDAVRCLTTLPSRHDPALVPGAKSRYDDFIVVHMNQSLVIHGTSNFLTWHRVFTAYYETALREECGYEGAQPYWNWGKSAFDPINSPIFDGSASSLGGNGKFAPHNCTDALQNGKNCIPAGQGGGCITSGPFSNMTINMGPIAPTLADGTKPLPDEDFFAYNPRCIKRDVSVFASSGWTTDQNSTDLITQAPDLGTFQTRMQGNRSAGDFGVHGGGHFTISGDPGGDFYVSPGDPVFWLHHAQTDRTWWIWQNQDPETRTNVVAGKLRPEDSGPANRNGTRPEDNPDGKLTDLIDMGVLGPKMSIHEASSSVGLTGGPFCYVYE